MSAEQRHDTGDAFRSESLNLLRLFGFRCKGTKKPVKCSMQDLHDINGPHTVDVIVEYDERRTKLLCPIECKKEIPGAQGALGKIAWKLVNEAQCIALDKELSRLGCFYDEPVHTLILTETNLGETRLRRFKKIKNKIWDKRTKDIDIIHGAKFRALRAAAMHIEQKWASPESGAITFNLKGRVYNQSLPVDPNRLTNTTINYLVHVEENDGSVFIMDMSGMYTLENYCQDVELADKLNLEILGIHSIGSFTDDLVNEVRNLESKTPLVDHGLKLCYFVRYADYYLRQ